MICKEAKLVVSNNSVSDKINDLVVNDTFKDLGGTREEEDRPIVVNEGSITEFVDEIYVVNSPF